MSFPSLPYELVHLIAQHLDPASSLSLHEAPSITRLRRDTGRALSLVSPNARLVGTQLVWRRLVVGCHRNPDMLERVVEERGMAEHVRQLVLLCSPKQVKRMEGTALEKVLGTFPALDLLSIASTPPILEALLSGASIAPDITSIRHLELNSSLGSSPSFPETLLRVLPFFRGVRTLSLDLRIPPGTILDYTQARTGPLLRPRTLSVTFDELPSTSYPPMTLFLSRLTSLLSLPHLTSLSIYSPYAPSSLLRSLSSVTSLTSLTLSLTIGPLISRLPNLFDLLPFLHKLETLKLLVQPHYTAPLILAPTNPLRQPFLDCLPLSLVNLEVDIDFCSPHPGKLPQDVELVLEERLRAGLGMTSWRCLEWEEGMGIRREVLVRRVKMRHEDGEREVWRTSSYSPSV
ncbi:hypothetical protein JCM11641_001083 [Rhodosporidiobolus odoratus]